MANNLDPVVSDLKEVSDVEALKNFLQAPDNQGKCIAYKKNGRVSYLAKIKDNFIHVDADGRSAPYDIREFLKVLDPKAKLIDLTGLERLRHLNYEDLPGPPVNPAKLIGNTVWQLQNGTYTESAPLRKLSVLAAKEEEPSINPPTSGNFSKR